MRSARLLALLLFGCTAPRAEGPAAQDASPVANALPPTAPPTAPTSEPSLTGAPASSPTSAPSMSLPPVARACEGVTLELKEPHFDHGSLEVTAILANRGTATYALMMTGDGSSFGRRNPTFTMSLTPSDVAPVGLCGFINPVAEEDFVTLAPGQQTKLGWIHPPTPAHKGSFKLRAVYKNDPTAKLREGSATAEQEARIRRTVPCEVTSNEISFRAP